LGFTLVVGDQVDAGLSGRAGALRHASASDELDNVWWEAVFVCEQLAGQNGACGGGGGVPFFTLEGRCRCIHFLLRLGLVGLGSIKVCLAGVVRLFGLLPRLLRPVAGDGALAGRFMAFEMFRFGVDDALVRVSGRHGCLAGRSGARFVLFGPGWVQGDQLLGDPFESLGLLLVSLCVGLLIGFAVGLLELGGLGGGELVSERFIFGPELCGFGLGCWRRSGGRWGRISLGSVATLRPCVGSSSSLASSVWALGAVLVPFGSSLGAMRRGAGEGLGGSDEVLRGGNAALVTGRSAGIVALHITLAAGPMRKLAHTNNTIVNNVAIPRRGGVVAATWHRRSAWPGLQWCGASRRGAWSKLASRVEAMASGA